MLLALMLQSYTNNSIITYYEKSTVKKSLGYLEPITGGLKVIWVTRESFLLGESRSELDKDEGKVYTEGTASV